MKNFFLKDRFIISALLTAIALNIILWIILYLKIKPSEYPIPLHYNIFFGVDLMGGYTKVYTLPGIGILILLFNLVLSFSLYKKERLASYLLIGIAVLIQVFLILSGITVILTAS